MSHENKRKTDIFEALKNGYIKMSEINLDEANLCIESDNEAYRIYEEKLTECEKS